MKTRTLIGLLSAFLCLFMASHSVAKTAPHKAPAKTQAKTQAVSSNQTQGFLAFPLDCGDPGCTFRYGDGPYTSGVINTFVDHAELQNSNGFWQYGNTDKGGGDGVIVTFDGSRANGTSKPADATHAADPTCIGGTWTSGMAGRLGNSRGCGAGYISYDEHPGYDYRAAMATPVKAAAGGRVLNLAGERCYKSNIAGTCSAWGYVGIDHGNGYITQYGHLSRIDVAAGATVKAGQVIGLSGDTGVKGFPHLHFEVLKKVATAYVVVDPYGWTGAGQDPLYSAASAPPARLWLAGDAKVSADQAAVDGKAAYAAKDYTRAFPLLETACQARDMAGCGLVGESYLQAHGVAIDYAKGLTFSQQACTAGNDIGCLNLANLYYQGRGVAVDYPRAVALYQQVCDAGETRACIGLGSAYFAGQGVKQDISQATILYARACNTGVPAGCAYLGSLYMLGNGIKRDDARAVSLLKSGCDGGALDGCTLLGLEYQEGHGVGKDYGRAAALYGQACDGGNAVGCNNLGSLYTRGNGVARNLPMAATYYKKACDGGNAMGCQNLKNTAPAASYEGGKQAFSDGQKAYRSQDYAKALSLFTQGCDAGNRDACVGEGLIYRDGNGIPVNYEVAGNLLQKACDSGRNDACPMAVDAKQKMAVQILAAAKQQDQLRAMQAVAQAQAEAALPPLAPPIDCAAIKFTRGTEKPSEAFGKYLFCMGVQNQVGNRDFIITRFVKTDGLDQVVNGIHQYMMFYEGTMQRTVNHTGCPLCTDIHYGIPKYGRRGETGRWTGKIIFEKRESGWVGGIPTGSDF